MNYIFVDIDGPLLPGKMHLYPINQSIERGKLNEAEPLFDNFAVQCFNIWAKYSNAKIIFSTNWATALYSYSNDEEFKPETKLKKIMADNGLDFEGRYHDEILTPKKFTSARGSEIWWWLMDNAKDGDKFIAVDDDGTCRYLEDYLKPREQDKNYLNGFVKPDLIGKWIEVDFTDGMTWKNFHEGCDILGIDIEDVNEQEFGIKKLTKEEKKKREEALDLLTRCMF